MSGEALAFMVGSWAFVLSLTAWCFGRVLRSGRNARDPSTRDGGGGS